MRTLLSKTSAVRYIDSEHSANSIVLWFDTPEAKLEWLSKLHAAHVTDNDIAAARDLLAKWEAR